MDPSLISYFQKHQISYKLHEHPAVFTVEQSNAISEIKKIPGIRTKNLFLKDENGKFYLVCLNAHKRLNIKALEKSLKVKHLKFGSAEDLKKELNLTPGSVSIFGMIHATHTLLIIDKEVFDADIIGSHPNINTATLEIPHSSLVKFLNSLSSKYEVVDLA